MLHITKGATDVRIRCRALDSTTGAPAEAIAYNATGIAVWYQREGGAKTAISLASGSGLTSTHSDGAWNEIDDGWYQVDSPDAPFAVGVNSVKFGGSATGYVFVFEEVSFNDATATTASVNAIADQVWSEAIADHSGDANSTAASLSETNTNSKVLANRITSTLFSGITSLGNWLGAMAGKQTANATAVSEINATGAGSGTFAGGASDSLEAIGDRLTTHDTDQDTEHAATRTAVAAAFTEIKGATWSSATDTLESIYNASGGGGGSVTLYPLSLTTTSRVTGATLKADLNSTATFRVYPVDATGAAVDTSAMTLQVTIEDGDGTTLQTIANASITKAATYYEFSTSTANAAVMNDGKWACVRTDTDESVGDGAYVVRYVAGN